MKKEITIGNVRIGGKNPVAIQSMTNTVTADAESTFLQTIRLKQAGAKLVRVSFPTEESIASIPKLLTAGVPIIADIHFSYKLALAAVEAGVSKLRINPSNFPQNHLKEVVDCCKRHSVPIRVGVNKGSVKGERPTPKQLSELVMENIMDIERLGYDKIVAAVKSSDVRETVDAYTELDKICDYPLHIGLTEAGTRNSGMIKSSVAIGTLLLNGIGDTLRVSLTGDPEEEVHTAKRILRATGYDKNFVEIVSCPTCARTCIDVEKYASEIEKMTESIDKPIKIAVMGCTVNGIGESKGADFGVAGGIEKSAIFVDGKVIKSVPNEYILPTLIDLVKEFIEG